MAGLVGKWKLVSSEGLLDVAKATGLTDEKFLKNFKRLDGDISVEYTFDGTSFGRKIFEDGNLHSEASAKTGEWIDTKDAAGRPIKAKLTVVNANETIREEKGEGYEVFWKRTISGADMTCIVTCKGAKCTRKLKKC